jgi:DNA-binding NarL/FixJ family response regulator
VSSAVRALAPQAEAPSLEKTPAPLLPIPVELTAREVEVLQLIANGSGNRDAARDLRLSEETVKTYVQRLLRKLCATSRAHAVAIGMRHRLIA